MYPLHSTDQDIMGYTSASDIQNFLTNDWALVGNFSRKEGFPNYSPSQEVLEGTHLASPSKQPLVSPPPKREANVTGQRMALLDHLSPVCMVLALTNSTRLPGSPVPQATRDT